MVLSLYDKVLQALKITENHNSHLMVKPEVILWPDPESQWIEVIALLQRSLPQLLVYGSYEPDKKKGPAIWLKCMIAKMLPEVDWVTDSTPIIYLPGIAKADFRNVEHATFTLQPLIEYQYTGALFIQENGREWTIMAFMENANNGLGVKIAKDNATKEALKKALPAIFQDEQILTNTSMIDAAYLNNRLFSDTPQAILKWMCKGDVFLQSLEPGKKEVFIELCQLQYEFEPDHKNIKAIAEKLGSQKHPWKNVWQQYINAPNKYPEIEDWLRLAKPADLGTGFFALPEESWPQVNEEKEAALEQALVKLAKLDVKKALALLVELEAIHAPRRNWVWFELGKAPLADALQYLMQMASKASESFSSSSIEDIKSYYTTKGYEVDQFMRKSFTAVKSTKNKNCVKAIIQLFYKPWLELITNKFQKLVALNAGIFTSQLANVESEAFVLFVDAFRYELAKEFCDRLVENDLTTSLQASWSAIPSLTNTAKPQASPIATGISTQSGITDFRPELNNGKSLITSVFRDALQLHNFNFLATPNDIQKTGNYWQEIGDIDSKGHVEQADMVKRIDELFERIEEVLANAFEKGIKRIKIVTDHGWLLLPGGLPKTELKEGLTETRWGRCALIKDGAKVDLLHLPWRWNHHIYIAYAPGITFFKANEEYAHGGISIHECLVPVLIVENNSLYKIQAEIKSVKWVNLKCVVNTDDVPDGYSIDIRTKFSDEKTSIVLSSNKLLKGNSVSLLVDDAAENSAATIVLLDNNERIIDKKPTTVGG